jgi:hypothetical protein
MRAPHPFVIPTLLIVIGLVGAIDCAMDHEFLWAAIWSLIGVIGWSELRETRYFNER